MQNIQSIIHQDYMTRHGQAEGDAESGTMK